MCQPNYNEWDGAVERHLLDRLDRVNFDHGSIVSDIAAKNYEDYCAHETRDFEDNDGPACVVLLYNVAQVITKDDGVADHARDRLDKGRTLEKEAHSEEHYVQNANADQ